ncbi:MAG: laccase domain-containing protein [Spirochaetaceae bacterium]|nr:laccase domain-containing protein [Spirochaetaceae bacterium]
MSDPAAQQRLCRELGVAPERLRRVAQRHTRRVVVADTAAADTAADGMIAGGAEEVLCVAVADCLPIFLIPRDGRLPALLHSGWRGTGIVTAALACLERRFGRSAGAYHAIIGPGIGPCCYDVPAERARRFRERFGPETAEASGATGRIDLRAANMALLGDAGVAGITVYDACTACSPALHSFRAERAAGRDGSRRMAALLGRFER